MNDLDEIEAEYHRYQQNLEVAYPEPVGLRAYIPALTAEVRELRARVECMAAVMREYEWADEECRCLSCSNQERGMRWVSRGNGTVGREMTGGHAPDCAWAAAMGGDI